MSILSHPGPRDLSETASMEIPPKISARIDLTVLKGEAFSSFDLFVLVKFKKGGARVCGESVLPSPSAPAGDRDHFMLSAGHGCMLHYELLHLAGYANVQGPILSAHKKLVAEKLLEEEIEHKAKGQAKKEKHLVPNVKWKDVSGLEEVKKSILDTVQVQEELSAYYKARNLFKR